MVTAVIILDILDNAGKLQDQDGAILESMTRIAEASRESEDGIVIHFNSDTTTPRNRKSRMTNIMRTTISNSIEIFGKTIPDELLPEFTDELVLFNKDALFSTLKEKNVQTIILMGVLSTSIISDIVFGLVHVFPNADKDLTVNVIICSDVTVGICPDEYERAISGTFPMLGASILTCNEAVDILRGDDVETFNEHGKHNNTTPLGDRRLDPFDFQAILRGAGVFIPSGVIVDLYNADVLSVDEIYEQLKVAGGYRGTRIGALKSTIMDMTCVFYFLAGTFLLVGLLPTGAIYDHYIQGLLVFIGYFVPSTIYCFSTPLNEWRAMIDSELKVQRFKHSIHKKATEYESIKVKNRISVLAKRETTFVSTDFLQVMQYIEEVIFSGKPGSLGKTDAEMLLLSELGISYTSHTLQCMFKLAGGSNDNINAMELHRFLMSDDIDQSSYKVKLARVYHIVKNLMLGLGYILVACFFAAAGINIARWCIKQCECHDDTDYKCNCVEVPFAVVKATAWLMNIGTLGFSYMAYIILAEQYDTEERARDQLLLCINYSRYYNQGEDIRFSDIPKVLEASGIIMAECEITNLVQNIDINGDGTITKQELEEYLQAADRPSRIIALLRSCIKDFNFISNTTWFFGALGYCFANYHEFTGAIGVGTNLIATRLMHVPTIGTFANYVGAIGYFLGGSAYAAMFYHEKKRHLLTIVNLKHTTKRIMKMYKLELLGDCNTNQQTLARANIRRTIKAGSNDDGQLRSTENLFMRNTALGNAFQHLDANKKEELYRPSLDDRLQMSQIEEEEEEEEREEEGEEEEEEEDSDVETEFSTDNKETSPKGESGENVPMS